MKPIKLAIALAGAMACAGCDSKRDDDMGMDETKGSIETEGPVTPEEAQHTCAAINTEDACGSADVSDRYRCAWVRTLSVTTEPTCNREEAFRCVAYLDGPSTPGCSPIPGCEGSGPDREGTMVIPAYRYEGETLVFVDECGSSGALGWTPCTSGATDSGVCACVCASAPS